MSHVNDESERWEQRLNSLSGAAPYLLLAVSAVLAALEPNQTGATQLITAGFVTLTAIWMAWFLSFHPLWSERRDLMALYYIGLLILIALLMRQSSWFGIFAFVGYLHAWHALRGPWRIVGVTATAALSATWQSGGLPAPTVPAVVSYLLFIILSVVLVSVFSSLGETTAAQNTQRKHVIAELAETNRRLEATLAENAGLHAQVLAQAREAGILDERQRMAGEIHDTLAQNLTGIITQLEAAEQTSRHGQQWQQHVDVARSLARASLSEARRSVQALRPEVLDKVPLPQAIADLAEHWAAASGVAVQFATTGVPQPLLPDIEAALFRVAQEALANVANHAHASRAGLTLSYLDDVVLLDVRDDGIGFNPGVVSSEHGRGYGLHAMEQRLRRVAGTLTVESAPGEGTALSASVPSILAAEGA